MRWMGWRGIQRRGRSNACCEYTPAHTDARRSRRRFDVDGVIVLNDPPALITCSCRAFPRARPTQL
jgi:hypothetical protein